MKPCSDIEFLTDSNIEQWRGRFLDKASKWYPLYEKGLHGDACCVCIHRVDCGSDNRVPFELEIRYLVKLRENGAQKAAEAGLLRPTAAGAPPAQLSLEL